MCVDDASRDVISLAEHGSFYAPNIWHGIVHMTYQKPTTTMAATDGTQARRQNCIRIHARTKVTDQVRPGCIA